MKSPASIALIVLNWNGVSDTEECLSSVLRGTLLPTRIFLADNGSSLAERERMQELYRNDAQVELVFFDKNLGFTKAHNRVFQHYIVPGNYEYLALLNNDAVAAPDWLRATYEFALRYNCRMVSSKMIQYFDRDSMDNAGHFMLNTGEIIPLGYGKPVNNFSTPFKNVGACAGACLLSVAMLKRIGFFDERFHTGYEDAELGLRAYLLGENPMFCPEAVVYHKMGQSVQKVRSSNYLSGIQAHIFYTWFKLMPASVLLWNLPSFFFKYAMVFLIDILLLRFKFLRVMASAVFATLLDSALILRERRKFHKRNTIQRGFWEINKDLVFFLWFDVKRFYYLVLKKQKSQLES